MRRVRFSICVLLLCVFACGGLTGCGIFKDDLNEHFVRGSRAAYDRIAPRQTWYIQNDDRLDDSLREAAMVPLNEWEALILEGEKEMED